MNRSSLGLGALLYVMSVSACGSSGSSGDDEHASSSSDDTGSTEGGEGGDLGDEICPDHLGTPVEMSGFVADDEYFYTMGDQAIHRTPVAGGDPEEVVQLPGSSFSGFVLGDEHLFFVARGASVAR